MAGGDELADVRPLRPVPDAAADLAAIGARVIAELDGLLPLMGEAYRREVAEYAAMTADDFDGVLETSRSFVGSFVQALADGVERPLPDRSGLLAAGRRRQEIGVSLDAAMHAFRIASRVGWTGIADAANELAPARVSDVAGRWMEYVDHAATAFAEGHTTAASEHLRRVDARRQALVADLLAAQDEGAARAVGARHGLRLADWYVPVLVATGEPFAAQDRLAGQLPPGSLIGQRSDHLMVLVPVGAPGRTLPSLAALVGVGPVAHGKPSRLGAALVGEVARAESILATAIQLGRAGIHGPGAMLLERTVQEHAGLGEHLRDHVLGPLTAADPDGIFRETLRSFLDDGAVRAVADRLFVHANTVTYRLRRVREVTGLDARVPAQATLLVLALALEDVTTTVDPEARP